MVTRFRNAEEELSKLCEICRQLSRFVSMHKHTFTLAFQTDAIQFTTLHKKIMHRGFFSNLPHLELENSTKILSFLPAELASAFPIELFL